MTAQQFCQLNIKVYETMILDEKQQVLNFCLQLTLPSMGRRLCILIFAMFFLII